MERGRDIMSIGGNKGKQQQDLFRALICNYNAIYYVDLNADRFSILYANQVVNQDVHSEDFEKNTFSSAMEKFTREYVRDEDKEMLLHMTDCRYAKKDFRKKEHMHSGIVSIP